MSRHDKSGYNLRHFCLYVFSAGLFNLRGSDIEFNPVFFAYAVVTSKSAHLFVHEDKITVSLEKHLTSSSSSPSSDVSSSAGSSRSGDTRMDTSGDPNDQTGQQSQPSAQHLHQSVLPETVDIQPYWYWSLLANNFSLITSLKGSDL